MPAKKRIKDEDELDQAAVSTPIVLLFIPEVMVEIYCV